MKDRVYGLETEYAIHYHPPDPVAPRPTPRHLYELVVATARERSKTLPVSHEAGIFLENGGLLFFEGDLDEGVIRASTPECRSARDATLYQQALDAFLLSLMPEVQARLEVEGYVGTLVLGRNSTDRKGQFSGAQESYYVADCSTVHRWVLRGLVVWFSAVFTPLYALARLTPWVPLVLLLAGSRLIQLVLHLFAFAPGVRTLAVRWPRFSQRHIEQVTRGTFRHAVGLLSPLVNLYVHLLDRAVFAPFVDELTPFLITRAVWSGSGHIKLTSGTASPFHLMQKSDSMGSVVGVDMAGQRRPIFDFKHLIDHPLAALRPHQRLQIGYSDSNMAEQVTYLKLAITGLLLQMIEDGIRFDAHLRRPMEALRQVTEDTTFSRPLEMNNGRRATALQIQRRYLQIARRYYEKRDPSVMGVLDGWASLLDCLEEPDRTTVWDVDWSAKKALMVETLRGMCSLEDLSLIRTWAREMDRAQVSLDELSALGEREVDERLRQALSARNYVTLNHYLHARRLSWLDFLTLLRLTWQVEKIDHKYHQLGDGGYAQQLITSGLVQRVTTDDEVKEARSTPPEQTRAQIRGYLVRRFQHQEQAVRLSWDEFHHLKSRRRVDLSDPLEWNPKAVS